MTQRPSLIFPLLLVFYEIGTYLSNDMYLPALPDMMRELALTPQQAQLTLTLWFFGLASIPLIVGAFADTFGRRPILLWGGVIYIISTICCALATNIYLLLFARLIEGGMIATMMVPGYAVVHESYEQKDAIKILALMSSISVLAPALGPLLGGVFLYFTDWRGIFWFIGLWGFLAILLLYRYMPETLQHENRHSLQLRELIKGYWHIASNKQFILLMMVVGFIFSGFIAWITAGPLLIIDNFNHTAVFFGLVQAAVFLAQIIGNRLVKYLLDRMDIWRLIYIGLSITCTGGALTLLFARLYPYSIVLFIVTVCVYTFGSGLCFAPLNRLVIETTDAPMGKRVALFTAILTGFGVLGSAVSSISFNGTIMSLAIVLTMSIIFSGLSFLLFRAMNSKQLAFEGFKQQKE